MDMLLKVLVVLLLLSIFYALGSALYYLIKDGGQSPKMVKALIWRLSISLLLFIIIVVTLFFNWI